MPPDAENSRRFTVRELIRAAEQIAQYLDFGGEYLSDFHAYSHIFSKPLGSNIFLNVLQDALLMRGMTLDQLRAKAEERNAPSAE
jgi:hypothetical protein